PDIVESHHSYVEPGRYPDVLDVKREPQKHFDWQPYHGEQQELHQGELQETHTLKIFAHETAEQRVHDEAAEQVIAANDDRAETCFGEGRRDPEIIGQVSVHLINNAIVLAGLALPVLLP